MKKKSLVAMGLAGVMTIGMCVPVLAQDINKGTGSGELTVSLDQPVNYTVTIPADMTVTSGNVEQISVGIKDCMLEAGKQVTVQLGGTALDKDNKKLTLTDENNVGSKIEATFDNLNDASLDATVTAKSYSLTLPTADSITNAGHYKGIIEFTIVYTGTQDL